jgi:hypothetical protein
MDAAAWALVTANLLTLATLVYKDWSATAREKRHRQYDLDDRALLAEQVLHTSVALAAKVATDSHGLAVKVDRAERAAAGRNFDLVGLVKENTEISTRAFHEANGAKLLIADTNKALADEMQRRNDLQEQSNASYEANGGYRRRATDSEEQS